MIMKQRRTAIGERKRINRRLLKINRSKKVRRKKKGR